MGVNARLASLRHAMAEQSVGPGTQNSSEEQQRLELQRCTLMRWQKLRKKAQVECPLYVYLRTSVRTSVFLL